MSTKTQRAEKEKEERPLNTSVVICCSCKRMKGEAGFYSGKPLVDEEIETIKASGKEIKKGDCPECQEARENP